jgi:mannosyltransferase
VLLTSSASGETAAIDEPGPVPSDRRYRSFTRPGFVVRHAVAALLALAALATMLWQLARPALWLDEAASVVATQRTWPNLWLLLHGADAPLVPYYTLLKALTTPILWIDPAAAQHPEVLYRLPSVVAVVVAVWALALWMARFGPPELVLSTGAILLTIGGLSRYGQEARPYAIVLMLAVTSTILWTQLINDPADQPPGRRIRYWLPLYALSIASMVAAHNLAAGLVAAHLVAALVAPERGKRRSALLRTLAGTALGLTLAAPLAIMAVRHGAGPSHHSTFTAAQLATEFEDLFTRSDHPFLHLGVPLALAVLGLVWVASPRYRFIARLAAVWAIVPVAVWIAAVTANPSLMIGRYVLFTIPAWAILSGLGVLTIFELVRRTTRHLTPAYAVAALLIGATIASQLFTLQDVRTAGGHSENIRPVLAMANTGPYARLPIVVSSQLGAVEIPAYHRIDERRLVGMTVQHDLGSMIWPSPDSDAVTTKRLASYPRILLLLKAKASPGCGTNSQTHPGYVAHCMPRLLRRMKYQVLTTPVRDQGWVLALLAQPT